MKPRYILLISIAMILIGCQSTCEYGKPLTSLEIIEKLVATIKMGESGLAAFYKQNPAAKKEIEAASGYRDFQIELCSRPFWVALIPVFFGECFLASSLLTAGYLFRSIACPLTRQ